MCCNYCNAIFPHLWTSSQVKIKARTRADAVSNTQTLCLFAQTSNPWTSLTNNLRQTATSGLHR